MRVVSLSAVFPVLPAVLAVAFFSGSCQKDHPAAPDATAAAVAAREGTAHATADGNRPPTAVFKTTPAANEESVITGGRSLDVTFNLCQSSDPDEGDELRFWFDYDNDGVQDEYGHCRATHNYRVGEFDSACVFTKVCVSDRQADHAICHTYQVCTFGKPRPNASPSVSPSPSPSGSPGPSPSPSASPSESPSPSPSPSTSPSSSPSPSPSPSASPSASPSPSPSPSPSTSPSPSPTPTPDPGLTDQSKDGDFARPSSKDIWTFTTSGPTDVTVKLDTVSQDTASIMSVCVSTSTQRRDCLTPTSKDRVRCAFDYPLLRLIGCPVRSYSLPSARMYYVIANGYRSTSAGTSEYTMGMNAHPGTGPLTLLLNNVLEDPFLEQ